MENKKIWMAVGGGFVAGLVAAFLVCSCCCPLRSSSGLHNASPQHVEMMKHKLEHMRKHRHGHFGDHHKKMAEMREHFAKKLGLTDEQKEKLEKMRVEDMAKMKPLFKQMDELRKQMDELREINRAHFESVLTDEQKEILKTMKKKHHHGKHKFRHWKKLPKADFAPVEDAPSNDAVVPAGDEAESDEKVSSENAPINEVAETTENTPSSEEANITQAKD